MEPFVNQARNRITTVAC